MTILQLISSEGYYGAESMLVALARGLSDLGHRSIVGVFRDSRSPHTEVGDEAKRQGLAVEIVPCDGRWDWRAVGRIRALLEAYDVDILQPHGYKADLYGYAAARPNRAALVATSHNWPSRRVAMRVYAALDRLVLRRFDKVATPSPLVAQALRRSRVPSGKVATIRNGVDIARFRGAAPTLRSELPCGSNRLVGFVGRLVPSKGGALLLEAARSVLAAYPDTTFVLVGEGPARSDWVAMADRLGIRASVVFAGSRDDMPGVYASLDMVILPSLVESMPMCLLEALAAGTPVIATRVGAIPELIVPGVTGLLLEPGDAGALAAGILSLIRNPALARRLGREGQAHAVRNFSAEAVAESYIELYKQALADRAKRTRSERAWQVSRT